MFTIVAHNAVAVTPSDSADIDANGIVAEYLFIGTAGHVRVITAAGTTVTFSNCPVGILPIRTRRVLSTGTGASNIVALFK